MAFASFEDIDAWVANKGTDGAEELRERLDLGMMFGQNAVWGKAWLARHDRQQLGIQQTEAEARAERQRVAAAASAVAAKRSWAMWSGVIAAITATVAVVHA